MRTKYQNRNTGERTAEIRANLYVEGDLDVGGEIKRNGVAIETEGGAEFSLPYKLYVAILVQVETDAPVATVLENTLGGTPVWARSDAGIYSATLTGAFPLGKRLVSLSPTIATNAATVLCYSFPNANVMNLRSFDGTMTLADELLLGASIEIRVYP